MNPRRLVSRGALAMSLFLAGCGSGSDGGTTGLPAPASVRISAPATELYVGQSVQLSAAALDADGSELAAGDPVWSTSDADVAQISESGLLLAMAPGSATLEASIAGKRASIKVTVEALPGYDVTVQVTSAFVPATVTVRRGGTVRFVFSGIQQNITFSTAFPGAPANIPNTVTGTISRGFGTVGDFRYESTVSPGLAGFVKVR